LEVNLGIGDGEPFPGGQLQHVRASWGRGFAEAGKHNGCVDVPIGQRTLSEVEERTRRVAGAVQAFAAARPCNCTDDTFVARPATIPTPIISALLQETIWLADIGARPIGAKLVLIAGAAGTTAPIGPALLAGTVHNAFFDTLATVGARLSLSAASAVAPATIGTALFARAGQVAEVLTTTLIAALLIGTASSAKPVTSIGAAVLASTLGHTGNGATAVQTRLPFRTTALAAGHEVAPALSFHATLILATATARTVTAVATALRPCTVRKANLKTLTVQAEPSFFARLRFRPFQTIVL